MKRPKYLMVVVAMLTIAFGIAHAQWNYSMVPQYNSPEAVPEKGWSVPFLYAWSGGASAAPETQAVKVANAGHFTLTENTQIGATVLPPGFYEFRHHASPAGDFVRFSRFPNAIYDVSNYFVVDVPCKLEALNAMVARTSAETSENSAGVRLSKLEVRGKKVAYVFDVAEASVPQPASRGGGM